MNDIVIKFEGGDVIIRGPKDILKIVIDPAIGGIQTITEPAKPVISKKYLGRKPKIKPAKIVSEINDKTEKKTKQPGRSDEKRYYCIDCKKVFLSKASKLDAVCPNCDSIHIGYASVHNR